MSVHVRAELFILAQKITEEHGIGRIGLGARLELLVLCMSVHVREKLFVSQGTIRHFAYRLMQIILVVRKTFTIQPLRFTSRHLLFLPPF